MIGFGKIKDNVIKDIDKDYGIQSVEEDIKKTYLNTKKRIALFTEGGSWDSTEEIFGTRDNRRDTLVSMDTMFMMYKLNDWVRAIVDRTVNRATSFQPEIKVMPNVKSSGELKVAEEHKKIAEALLQNPNKTKESFLQLRKKVLRDILIYDAGVIYKNRTQRGGKDDVNITNPLITKANLELISVSGDTIYLNVDDRGRFKNVERAYYQKAGDKRIYYSADEIIYMVDNPVAGRVYGLSPLETLINTVTSELYATAYNKDFFKEDATPRLAIMFDDMGTDPTAKLRRFRAYWEQELKGKPHRPIFLGTEEGKVRIEKIGLTNKDMEFMEYSTWLLKKIMAVYKCQPFVLGDIIPTTGKLNSEQQAKIWHESAILPLLTLERYYYNTEIIWSDSGLGFRDIYLDFNDIDWDARENEEIDKERIKDGRITINEWRVARGLEPVDWGDRPWFPQTYIQIGKPVAETTTEHKHIVKKIDSEREVYIDPDQIRKDILMHKNGSVTSIDLRLKKKQKVKSVTKKTEEKEIEGVVLVRRPYRL